MCTGDLNYLAMHAMGRKAKVLAEAAGAQDCAERGWAQEQADQSPGVLEPKCCGRLCCQHMLGMGMTLKASGGGTGTEVGREEAVWETDCAAGGWWHWP